MCPKLLVQRVMAGLSTFSADEELLDFLQSRGFQSRDGYGYLVGC